MIVYLQEFIDMTDSDENATTLVYSTLAAGNLC